MTPYDFTERLNFSHGVEVEDGIKRALLCGIPNATEIRRATEAEDRSGTDYKIMRASGLQPILVDFKHRSFCPIERYGRDDACIETCSVMVGDVRRKPGWTIDHAKRTDLIVYTWPSAGGKRRFWILYFPFLCAAAMDCWQEWARIYRETPTPNNGYVTLNVYVPRPVIVRAMRKYTVGETTAAALA